MDGMLVFVYQFIMDILQNAAGRTLDVSVNPSIFPP
jgi:hypothetical protein